MQHGFHSLHKNSEINNPALKKRLDKLAYVFGVGGSLFNIPQLLVIWIDKNTGGISLWSWGAFLCTSVFWLIYAIVHKDKALIFAISLGLIFQTLIVVGLIIY